MDQHVQIMLNGEPYDLEQGMTLVELLATLALDPRRVAIEHNLAIVKRQSFGNTTIADGDRVEIVNFVGGG